MIRPVIHYSDSTVFGGTERAILQLIRGVDRARWQPVVLHDSAAPPELVLGAREAGVETRVVPRVTRKYHVARLAALTGIVGRYQAAVFHAHLPWPLACKYGIVAATAARVPVIVASAHLHVEIGRGGFVDIQHRLMTRLIDRYIAVSSHVAERLRARFEVDGGKIVVIPNAVDPDAFDACSAQAAEPPAGWPASTGRRVALVLARLESEKGVRFAIEATAAVPDLELVIAGSGSERGALEAQAATLNVSERVHFLGQRSDVAALLASADLFVLPSLNEGLPLSVLEAMAAGIPVVATDVGGTSEAVVDGVAGILVPPGDSTALAAAIRRVITDPDAARERALAARDRVRREFSTDALVARVSHLYEMLLEPTRRA